MKTIIKKGNWTITIKESDGTLEIDWKKEGAQSSNGVTLNTEG